MTRTTQRGTGALIATLLAILLSLSAVSPASAAPDHRDDFALGRYMDHSDFGDWSSVLTQSLGILALHRATDATPSEAAVDLLLAQQCDDGSFPHAFRAPSTTEPSDCLGSVDTTAFAVQALDAIGASDAVTAATSWLTATQQDDGSFGGQDGYNSTSTGLAALALELGGHSQEAQAARDWVLELQDGCGAQTPGAIPFRPGEGEDDRGIEVMSTSQAVLGLAGAGLGVIDASAPVPGDPTTGCEDLPAGEFGDPTEAAAAFLVGELEDGTHLVIQDFASPGATIDVLFAMAAVERGGDTIDAILDWLDGQAASYTQGAGFDTEDAAYAGATAKLALAAIVGGDDPRNVGGIDLIAQLQSVEVTGLSEVNVTCDVEVVAPGDEVDCTITGLLGSETIDVVVELNPTLLDEPVTADSSGEAGFAFTVPEDVGDEAAVAITVAGLGVDTLAGLDLTVTAPEEDGSEETDDSADVEQVADDPDDTEEEVLPETGDHVTLASGLGAVSLLAGLGLVAATRRRPEVEHT